MALCENLRLPCMPGGDSAAAAAAVAVAASGGTGGAAAAGISVLSCSQHVLA